MRLRKNMKRTAAAVLALSMAVSAVAAPASAAYICDVSKGNVEISVGPDGGKPTITVGGVAVEKSEDDSDDIIITGDNTGDNTKPTESLNAEEENNSEAEKSGENTSEAEKSGENASEVEKSGETEEQAQEPGSLELLAPEDEEKQAQEKETQEPSGERAPFALAVGCGGGHDQLLAAAAVGGFKAAAGGTGLRTLARLAGPFHR